MSDGSAVSLRKLGLAAGGVTLLCIVVAVTGFDVSAWRDFEGDATMQDSPRVAGDRYHDPSGHSMWLPSDLFVRDSVRRGELPLWNRRQGGGYSPVNAIHEGVFHPFRWLTALFPRRAAPSVLIVLTLSGAAMGMYLFARSTLQSGTLAAITAAVAFALSPLVLSNVHFSGAILPLAHIPWAVLFLRADGKRGSFVGLTVTLTLLFVSGHPLIEAAAGAAIGGVAVVDAALTRSRRPLTRLAGATAAAVFLAAPALLPPLVAAPGFWTYKTQTSQGIAYFSYDPAAWLDALRSMAFDRFQGPCCIDGSRFYLFIGLPALVLAGIGAGYGIRRVDTRPLVVLMIPAFFVSIPGPWMAPLSVPPISFFKPWYLMGMFTFYFAAIAGKGVDFLWGRRPVFRAAAGLLIAGVIALNLGRAIEVLRPRFIHDEPRSDAVRFLASVNREPFRVLGLWGQVHMPNAASVTGLEDVRLAGPMLTLRYHLFWQLVDGDVLRRAYPTTRITHKVNAALLRDFNVGYVLQSRLPPAGTFRTTTDESARDAGLIPLTDQLPAAVRTPWLDVRQMNLPVRPRAHFAEEVIAVPSVREALSALSSRPEIVETASIVEMDVPRRVPNGQGKIVLRYPAESRAVMDVQSDTGGLLVLHDSFAEGWRVSVDEEPAEMHPVNVLSRGVIVPPGAHRIEMWYVPPGLVAGAAISLATALALLWMRIRLGRPASTQ